MPDSMPDGMLQPCIQDSEHWLKIKEIIERKQQDLEEVAAFELAVEVRLAYTKAYGRDHGRQGVEEEADLQGLGQNGLPPRILASCNFADSPSIGKSGQGKHRQQQNEEGPIPEYLLVARPVSRSGYLNNPKAVEAYWKELQNLENL